MRGDDELERNVVGPFIDWIQAQQKIEHWRWFSSNVLGFGLLVAALALLAFLPLQARIMTEKPILVEKASKIIEGGVAESEITEALEILLRINAGLYESSEVFKPHPWHTITVFIWLIALLAFALTPRTTTGVGKSSMAIGWRKNTIKFGTWLFRAIAAFVLIRFLMTVYQSFASTFS